MNIGDVEYYNGYEIYAVSCNNIVVRERCLDLVFSYDSINKYLKKFSSYQEAINWIDKKRGL